MAFKHYKQIKTQELPSMNIDNVPAFLKDFSISDDSEKPITSGLFRLKAGESLKYTYTYHEMKFIVVWCEFCNEFHIWKSILQQMLSWNKKTLESNKSKTILHMYYEDDEQ